MLVVVEGHRLYCGSCGAVGHMAKACPIKKSTPRLSQETAAVVEAAVVSGKVPDGEWKDVSKKGRKTPSPLQQQEVLQQAETKEMSEQEEQHQPLPRSPKGQLKGKEERQQQKQEKHKPKT